MSSFMQDPLDESRLISKRLIGPVFRKGNVVTIIYADQYVYWGGMDYNTFKHKEFNTPDEAINFFNKVVDLL